MRERYRGEQMDREIQKEELESLYERPEDLADFTGKILDTRDPLTRKIWNENRGNKRINGHSPEYVAEELGVSVDEVFPPEGLTVYVGDPWQKLDRKGVVIVDYEFGPVVEFQDDRERYRRQLNQRITSIEYGMSSYDASGDSRVSEVVREGIATARGLYEQSENADHETLKRISAAFFVMKQHIEHEIDRQSGEGRDPILATDEFLRSLWYVAVHGARAIDLADWEEKLKPSYESFAARFSLDTPDEERTEALRSKRQRLIESIRLEKTAKDAHVVQAMFPHLPFKDATFDRFVAFWSISTYVFPSLTREEMRTYWNEIQRVLKPGGKSYIGPIFEGNERDLDQSLREMAGDYPDFQYSSLNEQDDVDFLLITKAPT